MRLPLPTLASAILLGLLVLQTRPACAMDTPGLSAQASPVLEHILSFQDDPEWIYLLGGDFNRQPGQLQVLINGHPLDPGQVTLGSGCCLGVARSAWEARVAPGGFDLVEVASGGHQAMKLQRGGPSPHPSVRELLDRPAMDAPSARLWALVRSAFPPQPAAATLHAAPESGGSVRAGAGLYGRRGFTGKQNSILTDWFDAHAQDPYLNHDELLALVAATHLNEAQIMKRMQNMRHQRGVPRPPASARRRALAPILSRHERLEAISKENRAMLRAWAHEHLDSPYPTHPVRQQLALAGKLSLHQITEWFKVYRLNDWELDAKRFGHPWPGPKPNQASAAVSASTASDSAASATDSAASATDSAASATASAASATASAASAASAAQPDPPPVSGAEADRDPSNDHERGALAMTTGGPPAGEARVDQTQALGPVPHARPGENPDLASQ